eukprot:3898980-Prorocentrum_lima.AAC.1
MPLHLRDWIALLVEAHKCGHCLKEAGVSGEPALTHRGQWIPLRILRGREPGEKLSLIHISEPTRLDVI